ncbi:hypothetical protein ACJMK2_043227 [Sinanodonta woodiana]|uniref:Uncharacterized protein n=1 Tax=Sinanodonta woodiana TaxID=1069815 RepID=A0ABD3VY03_SINWO
MKSIVLIVTVMFIASQVLSLPSVPARSLPPHCPHILCQAVYIPPGCLEYTYLRFNGAICRGCDRNKCQSGY